MGPDVSAELFLKYHFAETKDLLKAFLTLLSATLVFSIAFAEKIVNFQASTKAARAFLVSCWVLLVGAIVLTGVSVCAIAAAGGAALYGDPKSVGGDVMQWAGLANTFALWAGGVFVAALVSMVAAGIGSMWRTS
jgi:hypothetical protein